MLRLRVTGFFVLLLIPVLGFAANPALQRSDADLIRSAEFPVYLSAFLDHQRFGIDDDEFRSPLLSGALGVWGWPGIGLELELGKSLVDDDINNLSLEVYSQASLNLRLESPPTESIAVYVLLGFSRSHLDTRFKDGVSSRKKIDLRGARATIGLTLRATRHLAVDAAFTHHDYEDRIGATGVRVGLRYDFTGGLPR